MALFPKDEYLARIERTKAAMKQAGAELLLCADPANMNYLTGYDGWSFYVPQVVLVALDWEEPIWIGRRMDASGARHTTFLADDNIVGYPDDYVQSPVKHPMNFAADVIRDRGWAGRPVGVEMDAYYFTARSLAELTKSLPDSEIVNADLLVNWLRLIKSDREIELMKQAGRIVEKVMRTALDAIDVGVRECDVVAQVYRAQIEGADGLGGDYPAIVPLMPSGEKTATPHLTWTDQPYENEIAINLELAGCRHRYHSPLARTLYLGKNPPDKLVRTAEIVVDGMEAALGAVKPGALCEDVERAWREHIARHGLEKESRIGYAMGLNYPPDWGEHTASLRAGDKTVLQTNMTFHMILGMWMDDWGFELSESFRVTETGAAALADFPRRLFTKP
jgi:Xaa-Pro dipeptidase